MKSVLKCSEEFKPLFKDSKCLLTISVGQEAHEGEKFASTVRMVNDSFKSCILLIDDSLQRHTIAINNEKHDADYFYNHSIEEGDAWLKRNSKYVQDLSILENIIRWDKWLKHDNYLEQQKNIKELIANDPEYSGAIEETIKAFLDRYCRRLDNKDEFNLIRAHNLCFDYIIEECVALCLWPELGCNFEVYPGKRNLAMDKTHKIFVVPKHPDLLHGVYIKFKNRLQFKPQQLSYDEN